MHELLAIIEVGKAHRVICQAPHCGRHVYKRIHVVNDDGRVTVLGEQCYSKLYLGGAPATNTTSKYTGAESRELTPEEIDILLANTQALIQAFEDEAQQQLEQKRAEAEALERLREEERLKAQELANAHLNLPLRTVKCHNCRSTMQTRAKRVPVTGYRCVRCGGVDESTRHGNSSLPNQQTNANDYRNIRG